VVFPGKPSYTAIQAAGVIASYFGMISPDRAVRFPVHVADIPQGNAVLIADDPSKLPASLKLDSVTAPTVAVRANPGDPLGKLLIITGADASQTLAAAQAVAMQSDLLVGAQSTVSSVKMPTRQPDDAPRWARTDQRIRLWDYSGAEQLQGDGSAPLNASFRIPPDIYYSDRPNALLKLSYRYNSIPIGPNSSMQVRMNDAFVDSVPLIPGLDTLKTSQEDIPVPLSDLRPFSNSLSFDFAFQLQRAGGCKDTTPINLQGAILRDSYMDLTGYPHYAPMPNLEIFANAGFPFTRMADLSETLVVLPPEPSAQEVEMFLTLMGHFSRQTGFPALKVTVEGPDALRNGAASDFLVLGTGDDQPGFSTLANSLPVSVSGGRIQVRDAEGFFIPLLHHAWWKLKSDERTESGELAAGGTPDAMIEGMESPFAPGQNRSVVAIYLRDAGEFEPFVDSFLNVQQTSEIAGSVSVLHGSEFQSFRIGAHVYHVGELPWWMKAQLWLEQVPWLIAVIVVILAFLIAVWTRQWLRIRARARLKMVED
jgi:cellulose synthase (UDP-forming)